jgi:hypothetical protein
MKKLNSFEEQGCEQRLLTPRGQLHPCGLLDKKPYLSPINNTKMHNTPNLDYT